MATLVPSNTSLKAKLFRGFSDVSRLSILETLRDGPLPVGTIVEKTGLSRTNVSNHLRCLADCDLIVSHNQGRYTFYQLSDPRVAGFLSLADELLRDVARGVYECTRYTSDALPQHDDEQASFLASTITGQHPERTDHNE